MTAPACDTAHLEFGGFSRKVVTMVMTLDEVVAEAWEEADARGVGQLSGGDDDGIVDAEIVDED